MAQQHATPWLRRPYRKPVCGRMPRGTHLTAGSIYEDFFKQLFGGLYEYDDFDYRCCIVLVD